MYRSSWQSVKIAMRKAVSHIMHRHSQGSGMLAAILNCSCGVCAAQRRSVKLEQRTSHADTLCMLG